MKLSSGFDRNPKFQGKSPKTIYVGDIIKRYVNMRIAKSSEGRDSTDNKIKAVKLTSLIGKLNTRLFMDSV